MIVVPLGVIVALGVVTGGAGLDICCLHGWIGIELYKLVHGLPL